MDDNLQFCEVTFDWACDVRTQPFNRDDPPYSETCNAESVAWAFENSDQVDVTASNWLTGEKDTSKNNIYRRARR